jgi:hypothetical protein
VVEKDLSARMDSEELSLRVNGDLSLDDRLTIRRLMRDYIDGRITSAECLDAVQAVRAYGSVQPGLFEA